MISHRKLSLAYYQTNYKKKKKNSTHIYNKKINKNINIINSFKDNITKNAQRI